MDMSFARRRKAAFRTDVLDLQSLLASTAAQQASSRTARIQARVSANTSRIVAEPLVEIFAPEGISIATASRFSDVPQITVTSRQSK
jgi:glycine cleavage system regulatory protein